MKFQRQGSWSHSRGHCLGQSYASRERYGMQTGREKPFSIILALSLPTQRGANVCCDLSGLYAYSLCSCRPQRLQSQGPVPLAEHLSWSTAVTFLPLKAKRP